MVSPTRLLLVAALAVAAQPARADQWVAVPPPAPARTEFGVLAGIQFTGATGGELTFLRYTKAAELEAGTPGRWGHGFGLVVGSTPRTAYLEAEGVLSLTPRSSPGYDLWAFTLFGTAGLGPVVRLTDGRAGLQATAAGTVLALPLILFVRPRWYLADPRPQLVAGFMLKFPVWVHLH
jgi:hypothetical protein